MLNDYLSFPIRFWKSCCEGAKLLVLSLLFISNVALAQEIVVSGKVTDAKDSSPLPGINVVVKGADKGTITDADGAYKLSVASGSTLTFSLVGYETSEVIVGNQSEINVSLKEVTSLLNEVLVTGSTIKTAKRELGSNITTVSGDALQKSGSNNLFAALQGKLPGAQITQNSGDPSGGMTIRLRGVKSLQGNSDPLYVIDGVIVSNTTTNVSQTALNGQVGNESLGNNRLVDINPADIESLNVLNGAAAAAQYGSRASNGVVLITTKRGKSGAPKITFSSSFNVSELRKKVPITTYGKQFGSAALRLHTIGGQASATPAAGETLIPITRDGALTYLRSNIVDVTRYDYQDQIFRTGYGNDNNISISGGGDKTQYFSSFSYSKNQGIIKGTDFERYNFRVRIDQRLADWAKLSAGITYANSFANEKANGNVFYSPINAINITNNIYDITKRDAAGRLLAVEPTRVNPLSTIEDMNFTQRVNRTINDIQLNLTPVKGLGVDWIIGVDTYTQTGRGLIKPYPYQATAGLPPERYPNGYASNASNTVLQFNSDLNISYETQLTSDIKLNAIVGANYQYLRSDYQLSSGQTLAPFTETVSGASTNIQTSFGLDQYNLSGYFGQATIGYKNLAFITGAIRADKSSKFSASQATQTYPKISASFIPSDLEFWKNSVGESVINSLKLRTSYGQAGNLAGIGSYDRFWQFSPINYLGKSTIQPSSQLANTNVRPERMTELEYGLDAAFLSNKINLGVTLYNQKIEDLVVNRGVAPSEGGTSIITNVGQMENNGLEVSLNIAPIRNSDFSWDFTFIYNRNRNKVTKLGSPTIAIATNSGAPVYLIEGAPASVFYGTTIAKDASGNNLLTSLGLLQSEKGTQNVALTPLEYSTQRDASGQPSGTNIRSIIGNPNPNWTGSFVNNIGYKNLNFNFLFDFVQGVSVFNADKRTRQGVGIGDLAEKELKGELTRGYIYALYLTEQWRVDDGSFVKLREIGLSYDFKNLIKGVENVNLGFSGRNLISWDNYNGFDPETNSGGNSDLVRGVDFGNVPIPRSYKVQLTVKF